MMKNVIFGLIFMSSMAFIEIPQSKAQERYREITVEDGGTLSGQIKFNGTVPKPKKFRLRHFPNEKHCSRISNRRGERIIQEVIVGGDDTLQDLIVYIKGITEGKPFRFGGADVRAKDCEFLVQGGPSSLVGVVVKNGELRLLNDDADLSSPSAALGVQHNPHSHEIAGDQRFTMFKALLPNKGQVIKRKVVFREEDSFMKLECDIHDFMQTYFLPVNNPYYSIIGEEGRYAISDIPPGKYEVTAWHPVLGSVQREVQISPGGKVELDFSFLN